MEITVNNAGRRGGLTVLRNRGTEFFSQIGKKGQKITRLRYPNMASKWGKMGGRPKKLDLCDMGRDEKNRRR